MATTSLEGDVKLVCGLIRKKLAGDGSRTLVGISGPPASGKSILAESVVHELNKNGTHEWPTAALLPMDGFHLDNRLLESRALLSKKGTPESFDARGFCEAVIRLKTELTETFFPKFDRQMDLSIANAIAIHPNTSIVIVEGNYLLLRSGEWSNLEGVFSTTVFVSPALDHLRQRLFDRWINYGLDPKAARHRAESNDMKNAQIVLRQSREADLYLNQNYSELGIHYAS